MFALLRVAASCASIAHLAAVSHSFLPHIVRQEAFECGQRLRSSSTFFRLSCFVFSKSICLLCQRRT
jgi:hypothetical protein